MSRAPVQGVSRATIGPDYPTEAERTELLRATLRESPPIIVDPPRLLALRLAIQSYGSVTTTGVEINILKRADAFARYLNGETDNRV